MRQLRKAGWAVMVVWHCQLKRPQAALEKIVSFLNNE
jgi:G:T-mismatch repair DNA endonuclease (very short patch repair protein)